MTTPRSAGMTVGELVDMLNARDVIALMNPDGTAQAFLFKATPDIVRLVEDLTMRADVPPAGDGT